MWFYLRGSPALQVINLLMKSWCVEHDRWCWPWFKPRASMMPRFLLFYLGELIKGLHEVAWPPIIFFQPGFLTLYCTSKTSNPGSVGKFHQKKKIVYSIFLRISPIRHQETLFFAVLSRVGGSYPPSRSNTAQSSLRSAEIWHVKCGLGTDI